MDYNTFFPVYDLAGRGRTSQHHPWQCSLKFPGFRGRHKCGVTLLSGQFSFTNPEDKILGSASNTMKCLVGPTSEDPGDPFVLVGAAHCNYVCKDSNTGNTLETCCCRPDSVLSSCLNKSPYCVGKPEFKLAEPKVCFFSSQIMDVPLGLVL